MIIGYAYVVGDMIHVGHLNHLEACRKLCDKLVVGVLTDGAVMEKKPRPIISFDERMRMVQALECVDIAISQGTYSPLENAEAMADILFESLSHAPEAIQEARRVMGSKGGGVILMPYYGGQSTTEIKNRIVERGDING